MKRPTSVTGTSIRKRLVTPRRGGGRSKGFTLWELLIVVAIVAITLSMIQFSVSLSDQNRDLKRVGKDLGKLIHLLSQEAVFENRNYAVSVQENGYLVLLYQDGEWVPVTESFFRRFKMPETQRSELVIDKQVIDLSARTEPEPHILILSSGEMTPFEWRIRDSILQAGILLQGNVLGGVLMTGPEPLG